MRDIYHSEMVAFAPGSFIVWYSRFSEQMTCLFSLQPDFQTSMFTGTNNIALFSHCLFAMFDFF